MNENGYQIRKSARHLIFIFSTIVITGLGIIAYFNIKDRDNIPHHPQLKVENPIQYLIEGNNRFMLGKSRHPDESPSYRHLVAKGQHPFAIVVTCSDSRLSPELIFDQGLGDLFVIRTAGNIISEMEMGSIEYAVEHLGAKHLIIMGHENCGAVEALLESSPAPGHIHSILDSLRTEKEMQPALAHHNMEEAIVANVIHQMRAITSDSLLIAIKNHAPLHITGMLYSMEKGEVTIIDSLNIK